MFKHCETNTIKFLLEDHNVNLSEPMIFGLSSALAFGYFNFKGMDYPFIGGRPKPFDIVKRFCQNTGFEYFQHQTTSSNKAQSLFIESIKIRNVGLQLDMFYLPYDKSGVNFGGHTCCIIKGLKEPFRIMDTNQVEPNLVSLKDINISRNKNTNMWGKNRIFYFTKVNRLSFKAIIKRAIIKNAEEFLNPSIKNLGYKGIQTVAGSIKQLSKTVAGNKFKLLSMIMEKGGTGGSIFRWIYADFLSESSQYFDDDINEILIWSSKQFEKSALIWKQVINHFENIKNTDIDQCQFELFEIAKIEKRTFEKLLKVLQ